MDMLLRATEGDVLTSTEQFLAQVDRRLITVEQWQEAIGMNLLPQFTQELPQFRQYVPNDMSTYAALSIINQPGPVFVASAHSSIGSFRLGLLRNPLAPPTVMSNWSTSSLKVTLLDDSNDEPNLKAGSSKKRPRPKSSGGGGITKPVKRSLMTASDTYKEIPFDGKDIVIDDLRYPASGCRPMRLLFSVIVRDGFKSTTLSTTSNPFMVISNCNQWKDGLEICLKHFVFTDGTEEAPFNRLFNYLQLCYLDSKGFPEDRFLDPSEIYSWLHDVAHSAPAGKLSKEKDLLVSHDMVGMALFNQWFEEAGNVFYDLHTSNVGKLFQKLWSKGFIGVGIGKNNQTSSWKPGHCRLYISTQYGASQDPSFSYLVLHSPKGEYNLLALERDHLSYFFEHSRHSVDCTHLMSAVFSDDVALPSSELFASSHSHFLVNTSTRKTK